MADALTNLSEFISKGLLPQEGKAHDLLERLYGGRYQKRHLQGMMLRDAYGLANDADGAGIPWAGLVNPDSPQSGPYGGASVVWFPSKENGSLMGLGIGTRGISPDEGLLNRPGHRRRVAALRRQLAKEGFEVWSKPDPANLGVSVPKTVRLRFPGFEKTFARYGNEMYLVAQVPTNPAKARRVVQAFLDLYAFERGWQPLKEFQEEFEQLLSQLRSGLFPEVTPIQVDELLKLRRFVVLQGPPGTGKTRLANRVKTEIYAGNGMTIQFHPSVTYEDFVIGLSPDAEKENLRFNVKPGWLLDAIDKAGGRPFLLVVDEINRADLGKILGEAIYLFEPGAGEDERSVNLAHSINGSKSLSLPKNLYVLGTMNTADRSIAGMDLAVRRRFAFISVPPERKVVASQDLEIAIRIFDRLCDVFVEHAPQDALELLPGQAYFLAKSEDELRLRFRHELLPLLDEYLREGLLGPASSELWAVRDEVDNIAR